MVSNSTNISNASFGVLSQFGFRSKFSRVIVVAVVAFAALALVYFVFNRESFHRLTKNYFKKSTPQMRANGSTPSQIARSTPLQIDGSTPFQIAGSKQGSSIEQKRITEVVLTVLLTPDVDGYTDLSKLQRLVNQIKTIIQACPEGSAYKGNRYYHMTIERLESNLNKCLNPEEVEVNVLIDTARSLLSLSAFVKHFSDYALGRGKRNPDQKILLPIDGSDEPVEATYQELHNFYISDFLQKLNHRASWLGEELGLSPEWHQRNEEEISRELNNLK